MTIYAHVSLEDKRQALARARRGRWDDTVAVSVAVNRRIGIRRAEHRPRSEVVVRGGVEPPTFRFSGGRSYRLSYLTVLAQFPASGEIPGAGLSGPDGI